MQNITYNVVLPQIGDRVRISTVVAPYQVHEMEKKSPPYDRVIIRNNDTQELSRLVITNGEWQIQYYPIAHTITFDPIINNNPKTEEVVETTKCIYPFIGISDIVGQNGGGRVYGTGIFHSAVEGDFPFRVYATAGRNGVAVLFDKPMKSYSKNVTNRNPDESDISDYYDKIVPVVGESVLGQYEMIITKRKDGRFIPARYTKLNKGDSITFHHWSDTICGPQV